MTVSGVTTFSGSGGLSGSGTVTANGGMVINTAAGFTIDGKTLVNPAGQTTTWTGIYSAINLIDGAAIVNDGTFNVQALGDLNSTGNQGAAVAFTNNGAFIYDDTGYTFSIQNVAFNVTSPGTVEVQAGTLQIGAGGGAARAPGAVSRPTPAAPSTSPAARTCWTRARASPAPAPSASRAAPRRWRGRTT